MSMSLIDDLFVRGELEQVNDDVQTDIKEKDEGHKFRLNYY
ncbi:hypothetical protein [Bacillus sp. ISL-77]|nr:hypothetical protein [Bacillus sp. ISL-77]